MAALMADVLEHGEIDDFGERFLRRVLEVGRRAHRRRARRPRALGDQPPLAASAARVVQAELLARIAERLQHPDAGKRAAVFGSQLIGILLYRHVLLVSRRVDARRGARGAGGAGAPAPPHRLVGFCACTTSASSLHGRRRRPRGQGHAVPRHPRRRRSRRARRPLRRDRGRRAGVPRHHRDVRQAGDGRRAGPSRRRRAVRPVHDRRGRPRGRDAQAVLDAGADKVSSTRRRWRGRSCSARWPTCSAPSASCWRSTPSAATTPSRSTSPAGGRRRAATRWRGRARASSAGRGRSCSPRWTATAPRTATTSSCCARSRRPSRCR